MRISDWSSDGCSSDLAWVPCGPILAALVGPLALRTSGWQALWIASLLLAGLLAGWALYTLRRRDRKSIVYGKRVSVRVDSGGPRILKQKITRRHIYVKRHYNCTTLTILLCLQL